MTTGRAQLKSEAQDQLKDLTIAVEKAKADATPKIDAELNEIRDFGSAKSSELTNNALAAEGDIAKAEGDAAAAIEKAKAEATPQIDAEIARIRELGSAKASELANAATAAQSTEQDEIAKLGATIEKAKAEATPQIDVEIARIREYGSAKPVNW